MNLPRPGRVALLIALLIALAHDTIALAQSHDAHGTHNEHADHTESPPTTTPVDPHAQHREHKPPTRDASGSSEKPREPIPPLTNEDIARAFSTVDEHEHHGDRRFGMIALDRLEAWSADEGTGAAWELQGWYGGDIDRVWLRSEGERIDAVTEHAEVELLHGHSTSAWWDVVFGIRHDTRPEASLDWLAVGVQGLAPQKFEIAATAYLGDGGRSSARVEAEYDLLLSNRLILQPSLEIEASGRRDLRRRIGSGITTVEAGLRLRYEITRRFAPYVGIVSERNFGQTARLLEDDGHSISDTRLIGGIRVWF